MFAISNLLLFVTSAAAHTLCYPQTHLCCVRFIQVFFSDFGPFVWCFSKLQCV